ncbi:hypothetical protein HKBW3S33_00420, partial [Candidatus Hakubella thermalkaliphila]
MKYIPMKVGVVLAAHGLIVS